MNAWKGHKELLDALSLMKHIPNWVMWIIGGPQKASEELYFENLITVAKDYGISDRVMFLGQQKNVPQFLAAADVYCQANTGSEGFSLSFTEAFTAGLPIVTTDIGSAQEIVDPRVGILTPVGDKEALATALISLTENSELRRSMSRNTRAWIKGLSDTNQQICLLRETLAKVCKST
jgi:glycosyltransferase involved in cell wall biosynthesis